MTLTELRYITLLAQEQHFGRAARLCGVSQPTLSAAVKKLETELGTSLFERTKTDVRPTPLGAQVVDKAYRVLSEANDIRDLVTSGKDPLKGPLSVGTLPSIGPYLLPRFIPLLQKLAPKMPLRITESETASLAKQLRNGDLDLVVTSLPFKEVDLVTQVLFDEPFVALLPGHHALAGHSTLTPEQLDRDDLLLPAQDHDCSGPIRHALPKVSTRLWDDVQGQATLETLRHMVASGLGFTLLPSTAAELPFYARDMLISRPIESPMPVRSIALAWRASFPRHQAVDAVRQAILATSPANWHFETETQQAPGLLVNNNEW